MGRFSNSFVTIFDIGLESGNQRGWPILLWKHKDLLVNIAKSNQTAISCGHFSLTDKGGSIMKYKNVFFFLSRICFSSLQNLMHGRNGGNENMRNLTDKGRSIKTQVAIIDHWSRIETSGIRKPWLMHLWRYPCIRKQNSGNNIHPFFLHWHRWLNWQKTFFLSETWSFSLWLWIDTFRSIPVLWKTMFLQYSLKVA